MRYVAQRLKDYARPLLVGSLIVLSSQQLSPLANAQGFGLPPGAAANPAQAGPTAANPGTLPAGPMPSVPLILACPLIRALPRRQACSRTASPMRLPILTQRLALLATPSPRCAARRQ